MLQLGWGVRLSRGGLQLAGCTVRRHACCAGPAWPCGTLLSKAGMGQAAWQVQVECGLRAVTVAGVHRAVLLRMDCPDEGARHAAYTGRG